MATSVEVVEFDDTSLGFPQPGETYAKVSTAGYIFTIEFNGNLYTYHTDTMTHIVLTAETPLK